MNKKKDLNYLIEKLNKIGHTLISIEFFTPEIDEHTDKPYFLFNAHDSDPRKVGMKPTKEFCRDDVDYTLSLNGWIKKGKYKLSAHENFDTALKNAIDFIDNYKICR